MPVSSLENQAAFAFIRTQKGSRVADILMVDVGVAKTEKYASRESGDTVELVERPGGGFSIAMIDGQGSGKAAKTLSLLLSSKAVGLLKDGVRDGAVARATHDYLFAFRHGQVSATFDLLSIDMKTQTDRRGKPERRFPDVDVRQWRDSGPSRRIRAYRAISMDAPDRH